MESEGLEPAEITIHAGEQTEPAAPYTEYEYTGTGQELSGYLSEKQQLNDPGSSGLNVKVETARVNGASYNNSLAVYNNQELRYNLDGKYRTFSGDVSVADNDPDKEAIFRIYVDGNLKYVSPKVKTGQIEHFSVNVSNGSELVMKVEDQNHDTNTRQSCLWLSPYLLEGNKALDESELYENLALNKPAEASSSVDDTTPTLANDGTDTTIWRGEEVP